jgi:hypothetical protein
VSNEIGSRFRLVQELHESDPVAALYLSRVLDEGRSELRTERWATSERSLESLGQPAMRAFSPGSETVLLEREGALLQVALHAGFVYAQGAAANEQTSADAFAWLRGLLPAPEPVATQDVPVVFWTYSAQGPMPSARKISVPQWDEIRDNYSAPTQGGLGRDHARLPAGARRATRALAR